MKGSIGIALGFATSLAFLTPAAQGQVFKCTRQDGQVTYTDVPCPRWEGSSPVDTRANVADHSSLRQEAVRLQRSEVATPPQGQSQPESPTPAPSPPAADSPPRPSAYFTFSR